MIVYNFDILPHFPAKKRGCDKMSNHFVHSLFFYAHLGSKQAITEKRAYDPFPHKNCFSTVYAAFFKRSLLLWYL